ncbi:WD40-repeat-containing domain protein [Suillus subalutaceus]|uniref:WD40-repeat-containing domain protein n=1 Tax=Suillus subalutaceus TaxID=48586 RepID=UPI001B8610E0|nr:WD40-repeat-containing domain protein [Suillus subalutaceus]KAG1844638.1 WD40-repeat-containing domain protein [Suillus subalutaceus]
MVLSPNGKIVVKRRDEKVRLWDVEMGKIVAEWEGHIGDVFSVCWSANGNRIVGGSLNRTVGVWNAKSGKTILKIKTGHKVWAFGASPGHRTERDFEFETVLITSSSCLIRIFDTATWQQIAILEGHEAFINAITLSPNNRFLASASDDRTSYLWNLDTNLPIGPPLQHEDQVECAALSADGKVLVTGCVDNNVCLWDVHAILKQAGLEDLLPTDTSIAPKDQPSFLKADATRCHDEFGGVDERSPRFFDGMETYDDSSPTGGAHPHSSASALLARLASLPRRFRLNNAEATGLPQPPMPSTLHPRVLLGHLSSLFHRSPLENDGANEPQPPSTPSGLDLHALLARLSSLLPRSRLSTDEESESHPPTPSGSRPDALMDLLSSLFRSQPRTSEEIELSQRTMHPHVVEVPAMRDREVLFVAEPRPQNRLHTQPNGTTTPGGRPAYPLPVRLLAHLVLFLCCASPQRPDSNAPSTQQQQGQSQGPVQTQGPSPQIQGPSPQTQGPSPQTQPAVPLASTSAVPTAPDTRTTPTRAATM